MKRIFLMFMLFLLILSLVYAQENKTCKENWVCEEWTDCIDDLQARKCIDSSSCGTIEKRPDLVKDCEITKVSENVTKPVEISGVKVLDTIKKNWKVDVGIVIVIIIIILVIYFAVKPRNTEEFYRKAERLNKKAEELHASGKSKKADKLNKKAEEYRRKARGV